MKNNASFQTAALTRQRRTPILWAVGALLATMLLLVAGAQAQIIGLTVTGSDGGSITDYRWVIEEDQTFHHDPANPNQVDILGLNFHRSYMPVTGIGRSPYDPAEAAEVDLAALNLDPTKHYFISVLPTELGTYAMGGAPIAPGQTSVNITLTSLPTPTSQISIFVFEDNQPINSAPDLPQEQGLANFEIELVEAGGRYGASGGPVTQDAFGNLVVNSALDGINDPGLEATRGRIVTNEFGVAIVKNLPPAKYGLTVRQPLSSPGGTWVQTSTIEGSKTIDAWVKANEPPYFTEFGPAGHHADFGMVQMMDGSQDNNGDNFPDLNGTATVSGRVVSTHLARAPDYTFSAGRPFPDCYVGLNDAAGVGVFSQACNADSTFSIPNVPDGTYNLAIWDANLDIVFGIASVLVENGASVDLGDVGVFDWFGHLRGSVFADLNGDGFRDPNEPGLFSAVTIRWRDGTVYDAGPTELNGEYAFDEMFPFFSWMVAEVDFGASLKATGMTAWVDAGGPVDPAFGDMNPQVQADGVSTSRTEKGEVLTQGVQTFLGQTNIIDWGKTAYSSGESGGVSGVVFYDTTRAEDNPVDAVGEEWQPGIPRVQLNLYTDLDYDGNPDDQNGNSIFDAPDVDNFPFDDFPGPGDIDAGTTGVFDMGDAVEVTWTDSWDDNQPTGCPGGDPSDGVTPADKCYDGLRNFNQVRDAVFDGGYAFPGFNADTGEGISAPGVYIVEVSPPPGYKVVRAHDKNVDFGEDYEASLLAFPPECIGDDYEVSATYSLFEDLTDATFPTPVLAGQFIPDCNRKRVLLTSGRNAPADFFLFTDAPVSARIKGFILDDLGNEFDPNNPNFGEKFAPPNLPVAFYDYQGNEVNRVYSDRYGNYNALVPSTFTTNIASPSGMAPNMLIACMNDPGPIADPANPGELMVDPAYRPQYSQFCYTFQYMPGTTTYLDTPVLPIAAFAGQDQFPLDCEYPNLTPMIRLVTNTSNGLGGPYAEPGNVLRIVSRGNVEVLNPDYTIDNGEPKTITRNYRFGGTNNAGRVFITNAAGVERNLEIVSWSGGVIRARVPAGDDPVFPGDYQLTVERVGGVPEPVQSPYAVTLTVGPLLGTRNVLTVRRGSGNRTIQSAINAAQPGDLVLVPPGVYEELVVMYKPIQLQGWGAERVVINAVKRPGEKLQEWRNFVTTLPNINDYLLPGQNIDFDPQNNEPGLLTEAEGAGILVLAPNANPFNGGFGPFPNARIDGISVTGADIGGGIVVNGYANFLQISNNRIFGNEGHNGGGIQVGHPFLADGPEDAFNDFVRIHHNWISQNGSPIGHPGGIALYTGTDDYTINDNYICGNFATGSGGGIGHIGLSRGGRIEDNQIVFNQSFTQMPVDVGGGGIAIEGAQDPGQLTPGAGNVIIASNRIQGNLAGAGDGGGIRLAFINGQDVEARPGNRNRWYRIDVINNLIHNNVSGNTGGGMSLQDAAHVRIWHNTIAHNDSTSTVGALIDTITNMSVAQPGAGIVSRAHTPGLENVIQRAASRGWSRPRQLRNNIIYNNRAFQWQITAGVGELMLIPGMDDLAVIGIAGSLNPRFSLLTDTTGYHNSNLDGPALSGDLFEDPYFNGDARGLTSIPEDSTPLTAAATDEGGNFIDIRFNQLTPVGDYHILGGSIAVNNGGSVNFSELAQDYDDDPRTLGSGNIVDIGADEVAP